MPSLNERVLSWLLLLNLTIITSVPPTTSFRCNVFTSKIRLQFNTVLNFKKKYSIMWTGNAFISRAQREWESIENFPYKMVHAENIWSMRHLFTQQGVLTEATKYAPSFFFNFTEQTNKWHKVLVRHAPADSHTISYRYFSWDIHHRFTASNWGQFGVAFHLKLTAILVVLLLSQKECFSLHTERYVFFSFA